MAHSPKAHVRRSKTTHLLYRPFFRLPKDPHAAASTSWNVPALCAAYKWPSATPGGGVIGIVELGGGWTQSDMDSFFQSIGQPTPSITVVSVDGTKNSPNQSGSAGDDDYEVALDIEVSGAAYYAAM